MRTVARRPAPGRPPDAVGLHPEDAPGRPGHLSRRTSGRSWCWPTSSPAPASSRPGSARAPCRWRCSGRWGRRARSSATRSGRTSPPGRPRTSSRSSGPTSPTGWRSATSTRASKRSDLDRIVLDLPEPWRVVKHATQALRPGGILVSYLPTIGQVARLREELDGSPFGLAETLEVLQRSWHVEGQSVRPDHRMVAHTGFLTAARLLDPDLPERPAGFGVSPENSLNLLDLLIILTAGQGRLRRATASASWPASSPGPAWPSAPWWPTVSCPTSSAFFSSSDPQIRLIAAISFLVGASMLGQGVGLAVGQPAPRRPPARGRAAPGRPGGRLGARNRRGAGGGVGAHPGPGGRAGLAGRGHPRLGHRQHRRTTSPPLRRRRCRPCAASWPGRHVPGRLQRAAALARSRPAAHRGALDRGDPPAGACSRP